MKRVRLSKGALGAKAKFEEAKHKRDSSGKFADKPGAGDDAPKAQKKPRHVGADAEKFKAAGKTSGVKGTDRIIIHVTSNPKKAGTASWDRFEMYKDGMTVDEYIKAVGKQKALADIAWDRNKGFLSVHDPADLQKLRKGGAPAPAPAPAPKPTPPPAPEPPKKTPQQVFEELSKLNKAQVVLPPKASLPKVADLKDDDGLVLTTAKNPYESGTPEWIKYQAFSMNAGKPLTLAQYNATKALDADGKKSALQKLIDDGHVKLVDKQQQAALAAQKAASPYPVTQSTAAAASTEYTPSLADARWAKAAGIKNALASKWNSPTSGNYIETAELKKVDEAIGIKVVRAVNNSAVASYTGHGFSDLNRKLRKEPTALSPSQKNTIAELDSLIAKAGGVKKDVVLYRGIGSSGKLNDIPPPPDFPELGYSSVSLNPGASMSFAGKTSGGTNTLFRLRVPAGVPGLRVARGNHVDGLDDEAEIILARGTRYRFVSRQTVQGYSKYGNAPQIDIVDLEVVRADGTPYPPPLSSLE